MVCRNVGDQPPNYVACHPRKATTLTTVTLSSCYLYLKKSLPHRNHKFAVLSRMHVATTAMQLVLIRSEHSFILAQVSIQRICVWECLRTCVYGVSTGHEGAARRRTHWHDVIVVKYHAAVRQGVNVRRRYLVRPMETYVVPALQQNQFYPA
jgi:hypothetical protein